MYPGFSLVVIAIGAIIAFGLSDRSRGIDFDTVGIILMLAGAVAFAVSMLRETRVRGVRRREVVAYDDPALGHQAPFAPRERVVERHREYR